MRVAIVEKVFTIRGQRSFLIIVCKFYHSNSYLYLLEDAASCIQMCDRHNGEAYSSMVWHRGLRDIL